MGTRRRYWTDPAVLRLIGEAWDAGIATPRIRQRLLTELREDISQDTIRRIAHLALGRPARDPHALASDDRRRGPRTERQCASARQHRQRMRALAVTRVAAATVRLTVTAATRDAAELAAIARRCPACYAVYRGASCPNVAQHLTPGRRAA